MLKDVFTISPDLITEWSGEKKMPALGLVKEKDLKKVFEVCIA